MYYIAKILITNPNFYYFYYYYPNRNRRQRQPNYLIAHCRAEIAEQSREVVRRSAASSRAVAVSYDYDL